MTRSFFIIFALFPLTLSLVAEGWPLLNPNSVDPNLWIKVQAGVAIAAVLFVIVCYLLAIVRRNAKDLSENRTGLIFLTVVFLASGSVLLVAFEPGGRNLLTTMSVVHGTLALLLTIWGSGRLLGSAWDLAWQTSDDTSSQ